jgi:hypothetical protein
MVGATLTPEDAYRCALGEQILSNTGQERAFTSPI